MNISFDYSKLQYMPTTIQFILVILIKTLQIFDKNLINSDSLFYKIVQVNSLYIAIAWILVYIFAGYQKIIKFYHSLTDYKASNINIIIWDIFVHFVPVLIIGLPTLNKNYILAYILSYVLFVTYYIIVLDNKAVKIYNNMFTKKQIDFGFFMLFPVIVLLFCISSISK